MPMNALIVHNHNVVHGAFVIFSMCLRSTLSCKTYELAFGAALVCFSFVPTFRHFRMLNVIGHIGTTFTEWYANSSTFAHNTLVHVLLSLKKVMSTCQAQHKKAQKNVSQPL